MAKKRKQGRCVYCGTVGQITSDHVPPRCTFAKDVRSTFVPITVPSCIDCNNGASLDDEEFKVFLGIASKQIDEGGPLKDTVISTVRNSQQFRREILKRSTHIFLPRKGYPTHEEKVLLRWDVRSARRTLSRTVRGLFAHHFGYTLKSDTKVDIYFPDDMPEKGLSEFRGVFGEHSPTLPILFPWTKSRISLLLRQGGRGRRE